MAIEGDPCDDVPRRHRPLQIRRIPVLRQLALVLILIGPAISLAQTPPTARIAHGFLATGGETYILDGVGKLLWSYPGGSRDGWLLPDGHVLLALSKGKDHPGGAVVEVDRDGKTIFAFE